MSKLRQTQTNLALFIVVECMCLIMILKSYLVKPTKKICRRCYKLEYPFTLSKRSYQKKVKRIKCISALTENICRASQSTFKFMKPSRIIAFTGNAEAISLQKCKFQDVTSLQIFSQAFKGKITKSSLLMQYRAHPLADAAAVMWLLLISKLNCTIYFRQYVTKYISLW